MAKKPKISTVKNRLWKTVSLYVRLKYSNDQGYAKCVTCGTTKHYTELQAGHFIPKKKGNSIYFVEENIHPQCPRCNMYESGNLIEYTRFMIDTYGIEKVDELRLLANQTVKMNVNDFLDLEEEYKGLLKNLKDSQMCGERLLITGSHERSSYR